MSPGSNRLNGFYDIPEGTRLPDYLARRLGNAYDSFLKTAPTNSYAVMDEARRICQGPQLALSVAR